MLFQFGQRLSIAFSYPDHDKAPDHVIREDFKQFLFTYRNYNNTYLANYLIIACIVAVSLMNRMLI